MVKDSIEIKVITSSNTKQANDFIELPFSIYKNNNCWVPWFNNDMKQFIDRKHPVFEHTEGEFLVAYKLASLLEGYLFLKTAGITKLTARTAHIFISVILSMSRK
jgi:hypothetical protein